MSDATTTAEPTTETTPADLTIRRAGPPVFEVRIDRARGTAALVVELPIDAPAIAPVAQAAKADAEARFRAMVKGHASLGADLARLRTMAETFDAERRAGQAKRAEVARLEAEVAAKLEAGELAPKLEKQAEQAAAAADQHERRAAKLWEVVYRTSLDVGRSNTMTAAALVRAATSSYPGEEALTAAGRQVADLLEWMAAGVVVRQMADRCRADLLSGGVEQLIRDEVGKLVPTIKPGSLESGLAKIRGGRSVEPARVG